ncbi:hypothetical protein BRYFOR_05046 [Marvinbryantia formatexigens DSM 14469]|uniref:Uncharacterized protein n=1 Tax=Marvinbryantia formatexigens DSM 14469 TaxID=478749 RepID=C6L8V7_9FIRM|nr:hypothetical protein BRYFOR_05046 [Marvinbryantia formatexigens DSM 14469]
MRFIATGDFPYLQDLPPAAPFGCMETKKTAANLSQFVAAPILFCLLFSSVFCPYLYILQLNSA